MKHSEINWPKFINLGTQLVGRPYVFGAEVNLKDPDPSHIKAIDCSELTEWLFSQISIQIPDGSYNQAKICKKTSGALLIGDLGFKWHSETEVIHHVGVYLGDNRVLEAKGKSWGTIITPVEKYMASPDWAYWGRLKMIEDA